MRGRTAWRLGKRGWSLAMLSAAALAVGTLATTATGVQTAAATSAPAAASGGLLRVGINNQFTSLDPARSQSGIDPTVLDLIYDRLLNTDPKTLKAEPGLATSWGFAGPRRLAFDLTLRQGVRFQDGTPLNANAVKASLEHYIETGVNSSLAAVSSVQVTGRYSVRLNLKRPDSGMPALMAAGPGMIVSPAALAKEGSNFATHPVGAGPFAFKSEVAGAQVNLVRSRHYWDPSAIHLSGVTLIEYSSDTALVNALQSGQIDLAAGVDGSDVSLLRHAGFMVNAGKSLSFYEIAFNPNVAPLQNPLVRVAFNLALDRSAMNQLLNAGYGDPMQEPVPPGNPYYDSAIAPLWPYDPAQAKTDLARAGFPNGVSMTCVEIPGVYPADYYSLIIANEQAVGINITVDALGVAQALQAFNVNHTAPCFFIGYAGSPDPLVTYQANWSSTGEFNAGHYNFGLDHLLARASETYRLSLRQKVFAQMDAMMKTNPPFAPTASIPNLVAYSKSVQGYVSNISGENDLALLSLKR